MDLLMCVSDWPEAHYQKHLHTCQKKTEECCRDGDGESRVNESKTSPGKPPGVVLTPELWI